VPSTTDGFLTAIRQRTNAAFLTSFKEPVKMAVKGLLSLGLPQVAAWSLGIEPSDLLWQILLTCIGAPLCFLIITALWCLLTAPGQIYKEMQAEIARLTSELDNRGERTAVELFMDKSRHYRESGHFSHWKIGVRNRGAVAAENVVLRVVDIVAVGRNVGWEKQHADEVKGMLLEHTHHLGKLVPAIDRLPVDDSFDLAETIGAPVIAIRHCVRNQATGKRKDNLGLLPRGKYRLTLRAEAKNADPAMCRVEISINAKRRLCAKLIDDVPPRPKAN